MFWVDLTTANGLNVNLIDGSFSAASTHVVPASVTGSIIASYLPQAKIGRGNYVYITSSLGVNYYGIAAVTSTQASPSMTSVPALSVQEAYSMDVKIDDGYPQTGRVVAWYLNNVLTWAGTVGTGATLGSITTCYDNGNVPNAVQQYSVGQKDGAGINCALGIAFQ